MRSLTSVIVMCMILVVPTLALPPGQALAMEEIAAAFGSISKAPEVVVRAISNDGGGVWPTDWSNACEEGDGWLYVGIQCGDGKIVGLNTYEPPLTTHSKTSMHSQSPLESF